MNEEKKNQLIQFLATGDQKNSVSIAKELFEKGITKEEIVTDCVEVAMGSLDDKCTAENFNLLEIMLAGRAVTSVIKLLFPTKDSLPPTKGTIVLATMEGDVHDLGKNILKVVLTAKGYKIIDCGKNCPITKLIDTVERENPIFIGISGLVTSVIPIVQEIKKELTNKNLGHIKVMAGGAALKQADPENLNVDFVAETAFDGSHFVIENQN